MWMLINKRHFVIFLDNVWSHEKAGSEASAKWKKPKESQTRLMSWYWKGKPTWRKDLITYNSHPWIMLSFNCLVIIWRRGRVVWLFETGRQSLREWENVGRRWTRGIGGLGVSKIGQFSRTSYVYHPWFDFLLIKINEKPLKMSIENEQLLRNELVVKTFTDRGIGKTRFRFSRSVK